MRSALSRRQALCGTDSRKDSCPRLRDESGSTASAAGSSSPEILGVTKSQLLRDLQPGAQGGLGRSSQPQKPLLTSCPSRPQGCGILYCRGPLPYALPPGVLGRHPQSPGGS